MERLVESIYTFDGKVEDCENDYIISVQKKLQEYEEAEEQGLLFRLPCPIGSTIYKFEYPTRVDKDGVKWSIINIKRATVQPLKFSLCHLNRIGELYFLTKEEAEQVLADMKKG